MSLHVSEELGFAAAGRNRWRRVVRGREVVFRRLVTLAELTPVEDLQREIMGATELDVMPASGLIVIPETGGAVLAAEVDGELAGVLWGFGGFVDGTPRIVSDWMGVRAAHRSLGLGTELKRLQATIAIEDGFGLIVWTVDPLRAANARLNIAKLGATSHRYEVDRYGAYAEGLYGTMPTDRLHMAWDLGDPSVLARLKADATGAPDGPEARLPESSERSERLVVEIPADIDRLVQTDPGSALEWRLGVRGQLQAAFAGGFVLDGFRPGLGDAHPALILTRKETR